MPKVTVLMPVFNAGNFLKNSVKSILNQSFHDFEFLIIDDASTDDSIEIIEQYRDPRIRHLRNDMNRGVALTLNRGLDEARGEYIARMDADDIAMRNRLKHQISFMDANPQVGISGSWIRLFGDQPPLLMRAPVGSPTVNAYMLFDNPLFHPTVIMRHELIQRHRLRYDPTYNRTEDFDLWTRAVKYFSIANLPEALMWIRCHKKSVTTTTREVMTSQAKQIFLRGLEKLNLMPTDEDLEFHRAVGSGCRLDNWQELEKAETWLLEVKKLNDRYKVYETKAIAEAAGIVWFRSCAHSTPLGNVWQRYKASELSKGYNPPFPEILRFGMSMIWHGFPRMKSSQ